MGQFLRETWELWYWACFRPSLLQQRMNAWAPQEEDDGKRADTAHNDMLAFVVHPRFLAQFALLVLLLCTPLMALVATTGEAQDWFFVLSALFTAYGVSVFFLPSGLSVPLLFALVYRFQVTTLRQALTQIVELLPPLPQLALGLGSYTAGLVFTSLAGAWLWRRKQVIFGRSVLVVGTALSVAVGGGLAIQNWQIPLFSGGVLAMLIFSSVHNEDDPDQAFGVAGGVAFVVALGVALGVAGGVAGGVTDGVAFGVALGVAGGVALGVAFGMAGDVTLGVAFVVAGIVALGVAFVVAGGVAGGVAGVSLLPLWPLLLAAWLMGFASAPLRGRWSGWVIAGVFVALTFERQGWWALVVGVAALGGFYRLLPHYPLLALLSFTGRIQLRRLPPFGDEVLWFPLPEHSRILAAAFREDAAIALLTLQQMRASPYLGYRRTVRRALPQIVADQLTRVQALKQIAATVQADHPLLPQLIPDFYQRDETEQRMMPTMPKHPDELTIVLPRLLSIAEAAGRALEAANPALVERGLERCVTNLGTLQGQLLGLGLKSEAITRWQPVFVAWERVLQQESAHQHTLSQGEVLNPC